MKNIIIFIATFLMAITAHSNQCEDHFQSTPILAVQKYRSDVELNFERLKKTETKKSAEESLFNLLGDLYVEHANLQTLTPEYTETLKAIYKRTGKAEYSKILKRNPIIQDYIFENEWGVDVVEKLHTEMNSFLRSKKISASYQEMSLKNPDITKKIEEMDHVLQELPDVDAVVFRGGSIRLSELERLKKSQMKIYSDRGYMSTTFSLNVAFNFSRTSKHRDKASAVFIIKTKKGNVILPTRKQDEITDDAYSLEQEVLIPRGARFRILGFSGGENSAYSKDLFIYMEDM